jgi:PKD repeat protein
VAAEVADLKDAKYIWECDGGTFSGPKNLFQNVWVAPRKAGEYTVTCTVEANGESDTRSTTMTVGDYFFDKFSVASTNFSLSNFTATYANGEVRLVGSKSNTRGSFRREFGDTALVNPFTYKADMAWRDKYKNTTSSMYYRMQFNKPVRYDGSKVKQYIREIRLELWPTATGTNKNYSLSYEVFSSVFSTSTWTTIESARKDQFVFTDGAKAADKLGMRPISISVDANFNILVGLDGATVLQTDAIKTWRITNTIPDKLNLKSVWVEVYEQTNFYMDNITLTMN